MNQEPSQQEKMAAFAVCIAGAHRSGTSMLTRLLHSSGLELGPESELMAAQADNPDGFWENLRFVALNDEVLNELGGAWDLPPPATEDFEDPRIDPLRVKARLLIAEFDPVKTWGWKDPRNSLTVSFWRKLLPHWKVVIMVRNPLEVAYSMRARNGTSYSFGLRLWEIYNRRLLESTNASERLVSHYDSFFDNPQAELERIARFIGLPSPAANDAAALVARKRRHTHFTTEQLLDARVSTEVVELYQRLRREANREPNEPAARRLSKGSPKAHSTKTKRSPKDLLPGAISRLNVSIPNSETARQELAQLRGDKISSHSELDRLHDELRRSREELAHREGRITEMERNAVRHEQDRATLQDQFHQERQRLEHELRQSTEELARREGRITEMERDAVRREQDRTSLQGQLQESAATVARLDEQLRRLETEMQQRRKSLEEEMQQIRDRFVQTNQLLHGKSISLAENEARVAELTTNLRRQLQATKKLSHLLDDLDAAAARLRSSRRWKMANPIAALKAAFFPKRRLLGYGHLEKIVSAYSRWRSIHPEVDEIDHAIQALNPRENSPSLASAQAGPSANGEPARPFEPPAPTEPIEFAVHDKVDTSIIIPVFDQLSFTLACLASLQRHAGSERFEVIVVDDGSTDATAETIKKIPGINYSANEKNSGFIASCNRGAELARGTFLLFLNNDVEVTPGWLTALRETFDFEPRAGLIGSKLVFPDGRLQEAGGIIWSDGSGWNRGKFKDPESPEYNFLCEVDYCSGACVMIAKSLFESLGGFDSRYAPGYYEDTDLAFKVRRQGLKVFYQPLSKVIHYEGATGGTDLASGAKRYQAINRATFVETWAETLSSRPSNGDLVALEGLEPGRKRILVIDHHLPMPDRDSGSLRMFQILKILHTLGHSVTFLPDNLADIPPYADALRARGIEVIHHPYVKSIREYLQTHGQTFDVVILSRCDFARKHIADVRLHAPQSRIIFDTVDLHFLRQDREAELLQDPEMKRLAFEKQREEYELIDQSDETWVVSGAEQELLCQERPNKSIEVVSNIVDIPGSTTPFSLRHDFLFIGSFQHTPNVDAVIYFTKEIYPLVKNRLNGAKFYIIGDKAPPSVIALASEDVIITGLQPDVAPYFESVKLSIAPLRFGAGVKGKINQSMGFGVPVVASSVAVEGMFLTDHEDTIIADTPEDFARSLVEVYESKELWERVSRNGLSKTRALYSPEVAQKQLERLFSDNHVRSFAVRPFSDEDETAARQRATGIHHDNGARK